jgi:hypothetical protein
MTLAADLITVTHQEANFLNNVTTVYGLKIIWKGRFVSVKEVTPKVMTALTEVQKNGFQKCL